ncbi:MAG TPA: TonB-dependent receptor [Pyrinomonadaceae bacterium]|nr:TonB-dependent receptor [Pyrinomonadaceae bacterium]
MTHRITKGLLPAFLLLLLSSINAVAQNQTTGRIAGTVQDQNGAVIAGAEATVSSKAMGDERRVTTDSAGNYAVPLLSPGMYRVRVTAEGFNSAVFDNVQVVITETTSVNSALTVAGVIANPVLVRIAPLIQRDGPQLGRVVDSRAVTELPLATRNFTQILGLSPGTSMDLPDNTAVGRNSQNISVNGARTTQNNYQINGVDANFIRNNNLINLAVPAPESIQEFKVQTSLYDATFGRSGGGNIQAVTRSGANDFHGAAYEYFRNDAFNANNPFLKAAGVKRPVLRRNVFGGLLGGRIKTDKAFFFGSYQGTRERNGASLNSLSSNVLIAPGLTNDRSEQTLRTTFNLPSINPVALALLNVKLPSGQFLIPTPQANGRYSGSTPSSHQEDQFNANVDYRVNERNWLAVKFFFSNLPQTLALFGGTNVPGFAAEQAPAGRLISLQDIHTFSSNVINEARIGYNLRLGRSSPHEPVKDADVGIRRANEDTFPGLSLIRIAPGGGGIVFGTASILIDQQIAGSSTTLADILSITRGKHCIRTGAEIIYYQHNSTENLNVRGQIDFNNFNDFLTGTVLQSVFGTGINYRSLRATDYSFFVQDDWRFSRRWTFNLGLRYELDMPAYDTRGRNIDFDPALYKPRLAVGSNGNPVGPPIGGFVQAGNMIPQYDLPDVPNVGKRIVRSVDPNNFAPRIGFVYSPLDSGRLVVRGGYGIFYSRISITHLLTAIQLPPNYIVGRKLAADTAPFANPFFPAPSVDKFPSFVPGIDLATLAYDRNLRTPYSHQYNVSVQYAMSKDVAVEIAYVGGRGFDLLRDVGINQARLASPQHPIINEVLSALNLPGAVITTNTPGNAQLRAPFQGVSLSAAGASVPGFGQTQTTAQSTYNSLQLSVTRRLSRGLQFLASYTFARSIDNASGGAIGGASIDSGPILGNQLDNRANRDVSNFDRTHRFVLSYLWDLPKPALAARSNAGRLLFSNWQVAGIITAMSGLPIDIVDPNAGSLYLSTNNGLSRPNWSPGNTLSTATTNIPAGYFFNPFAFVRPIVPAGQLIPSSNGAAVAGATCGQPIVLCTDFGSVGRNALRGPSQTNVDFSIIKRFPIRESKNIEFRVEFFNLFNHVNFANPISNFNAVTSFHPNTGQVLNPGDFGRIISTSNNPRLIQLALKLNF